MRTITVNGTELNMVFTYAAAECKELVQRMFSVVSGSYILKNNSENRAEAVLDGTAEMVAEIPQICSIAFYAGLLEKNPSSFEDARSMMRTYMEENDLSYAGLYKQIKAWMEEDGFFKLSGLTEMLEEMSQNAEEKIPKQPKAPQDHRKKSTSTK
ncbi:MAG: hypothetical protein EGR48_00345 [Lachnospiraceae bacterium]|nr:hypothetical protein [Lachnospiraceae bacterium]